MNHAKQAAIAWGAFIVLAIVINATIPFALGADVRDWTYSTTKDLLFHTLCYGAMFLALPLVLVKGWTCVRQPQFLIPLIVVLAAISIRPFFRPSAAIVIPVLAYLHWKFDLSDLGFRSRGWKGDILAVLILGSVIALPRFFQSAPFAWDLNRATSTLIDRLLANPASTTEVLFYFGFLAERLGRRLGNGWTPLAIGLMYAAHEMTNPEYWYEKMSFPLVFVGVTLIAAIYLWRRNVIILWLSDGLGRFIGRLA